MTGEGGDAPISQDLAKKTIGGISFGTLGKILNRSSLTKGYSPGEKSYKLVKVGTYSKFLEYFKDRLGDADHLAEVYKSVRKILSDTAYCTRGCGGLTVGDQHGIPFPEGRGISDYRVE